MAYDASANNEDEVNPQLSTGGAPSSQSDGSTPTGQAQQRSSPSNKPNIQSYLRANQGAGTQLAGGIENQAQRQAGQFNNQVQKSTNQLNSQSQPLEQKLGSDAQNVIQQSFKNPQDILKNQDQLKQFQQLRDQGYQGDIKNLQTNAQNSQQQLQSQLGGIQGSAQNAGTESGRFQLLRDRFGQPSYSSGQQKLDNLFLQAQPTNLQQNLTGVANQAGQQFNSANNAVQSKLNALNNMSTQNATDIQNTFGKGLSDINTDVSTNQQKLVDLKNQLPAYQQAAANNTLSADQAKQLGLDTALGNNSIWGVDLSKYFNNTDPSLVQDPTLAQAASQDQLSRYGALNTLAGNHAQDIFGGATTAGGYDPFGLRTNDLKTDVDAARQNAINQTQSDIAKTFGAYGINPASNNNSSSVPLQFGDQYLNGVNQVVNAMTNKGFSASDPGAPLRGQVLNNLNQIVQQDANDPGKLAQDYHNWWDQSAQIMHESPEAFRQALGRSMNGQANDAYTNSARFQQLMNQTLGSGKIK